MKEFKKIYFNIILLTLLYNLFLITISLFLVKTVLILFLLYFIPALISAFIVLVSLIPIKEEPPLSIDIVDHDILEKIKSLSGKFKTYDVDEIRFVAEYNAFITDSKKKILYIGFPLLFSHNIKELEFILVHELSHFSEGDPTKMKYARKVIAYVDRIAESTQNRFLAPFAAPYLWIGKKVFYNAMEMSRKAELKSDLNAANIVGKELSKTALIKLSLFEQWSDFLYYWISFSSLVDIGFDLNAALAYFNDLVGFNAKTFKVDNYFAADFSSHPTLFERLENLDKVRISSPTMEYDNYHLKKEMTQQIWENIFNISKIDNNKLKSVLITIHDLYLSKFGEILESIKLTDFNSAIDMYGELSFNLYKITGIDDFDYERLILSRLISYEFLKIINPTEWTIGYYFSFCIDINGKKIDLFKTIYDDFEKVTEDYELIVEMIRKAKLK